MINEGWIWTYYDCSYRCFLFGKIELPCIIMTLSEAVIGLIMIGIILYTMKKLIEEEKITKQQEENNGKKKTKTRRKRQRNKKQ